MAWFNTWVVSFRHETACSRFSDSSGFRDQKLLTHSTACQLPGGINACVLGHGRACVRRDKHVWLAHMPTAILLLVVTHHVPNPRHGEPKSSDMRYTTYLDRTIGAKPLPHMRNLRIEDAIYQYPQHRCQVKVVRSLPQSARSSWQWRGCCTA